MAERCAICESGHVSEGDVQADIERHKAHINWWCLTCGAELGQDAPRPDAKCRRCGGAAKTNRKVMS